VRALLAVSVASGAGTIRWGSTPCVASAATDPDVKKSAHETTSSQCPHCGQKLFGLVSRCFRCKQTVGVLAGVQAARAAESDAREERRRRTLRYRLWFRLRFGALRRACVQDRAELYAADYVGKEGFAFGNVLFNSLQLHTTRLAGGQEAWSEIEKNPKLIRAALTCRGCGFVHILRQGMTADIGMRLTGMRIGAFVDPHVGFWVSSWFQIARPVLRRGANAPDILRCARCEADVAPKIARY
jgi:predicted RNA-binding Zn-ribbon protein involved in translation (DUF1610 family)